MFHIHEIIDLAIQIENNGANFFRQARQSISSPAMQALLEWMAEQESSHVQWFRKLRQRVAAPQIDPRLAQAGRQILRDYLGDQTFSLKQADLGQLRSVTQLLELAREFELDTVAFYELLSSTLDDEQAAAHLEQIIAEERRHAELLERYLSASGEAELEALLTEQQPTAG
jgi:rubrerythrin